MAFAYVIIDGKRVNKAFADNYHRMNRAFRDAFGLYLIISDGVRLYSEQKAGYLDYISGRTTIRWANPDSPQAYHVETNPSGPRAIDIRDSGASAGVTRYGNARSNWIRDNARKFNWNPRGYHEFNEPWHLEAIGTPAVEGQVVWLPTDKLNTDGQLGPQTISKLQSVLGVTPDGQLGPITISALQRRVGVSVDGEIGPQTISAMQKRIGAKIDGQWGSATTTALQIHLNSGGTLSAPVVNPPVPVTDQLVVDGILGKATIEKWQKSVGAVVDGELGPDTIGRTQKLIGATPDGILGPQTIKGIQANVGATQDGQFGKDTITKLQIFLNAGKPFQAVAVEPEAPAGQIPADELEATPALATPTAADFPSWIRFETVLDPEGLKANLNIAAQKYYGKPYLPIESHTHWWGEPGKAGTHDGNVSHIKNTADLSVNFVVSEKRITLMVPLNKIALTTGARNPYAWKSENDPTLTDWQYKTMGYLHYIVEKLNPSLVNQPIRLHKEFYATSCSEIDRAKVREYANAFQTGKLNPATGLPPEIIIPDPEPLTVQINKDFYDNVLKKLPQEFRSLADDLDEGLV